MIELRDVAKTYTGGRREVRAVRGVSLRVDAGEFVSIMGPSGSGKSTLLHLMGALDVPSSGQVLFAGDDLRTLSDLERSRFRRRKIGFVFQAFHLLPHATAVGNVALPLMLDGTPRRTAIRAARDCLGRVGLDHRADHYPDELSGGEMQRVAVARALVADPNAVLCDEPTGNLDTATGREILAILASLPEPGRRAVVMVTHDPAAAAIGSRRVDFRDGIIESDTRLAADDQNSVGEIAKSSSHH
ncbi:MAG: ABC transporter ATP-binding protein [Gemmataceae bacterium]|nr:ABC transporter ATP-binding protein [Gemmataceae bacterium]